MAVRADNVDTQSLRGFLKMVERDYPDQILRVSGAVDTRFEMTSVVFELERAGKNPVIIFEKPAGFNIPVVTNVAANRRLLAACLGVEPGQLPTAFRERCQKYIPCEVVSEAAWNDVVIEGEDVDLTKLPIPLQFSVDAAPYITAGQISARDPVTGVDTTGFHRLMLKGKNRLGVSLHSRRRMYEFHRRAEERGESLPAVITHRHASAALHGLDGLCLSAECAEIRDHRRPVRRAISARAKRHRGSRSSGGRRNHHRRRDPCRRARTGRSVRRVHRLCVLPQHAEVFVAKRIRMRRDAMYQCRTSGMSKDHILVSCVTREGEILNALRRNLPNVSAVHVPHTTCGAFMAFISMKKTAEGEPQMADHGDARHRALYQIRDRRGR